MTHPQTEAKGAQAKAAAMDAVGEIGGACGPSKAGRLMSDWNDERAMTNETEYGPEIVVYGRPPWLGDDDLCNPYWSDEGWYWTTRTHGLEACLVARWDKVIKLRLLASHPASIVAAHNAKHGTQFKYWPGGDEAPGDLSGLDVLLRNGVVASLRYWPGIWKPRGQHDDIIGYTPKPCAEQQGASEPLQSAGSVIAPVVHGPAAGAKEEAGEYPWSRPMCSTCRGFGYVWCVPFEGTERYRVDCGNCKADWVKQQLGKATAPPQPDFVPCERTVRLCIEKVGAINSHGVSSAAKHALETLLPKKDRAEELVEAWESADPEPLGRGEDGVRKFARWILAQGEIRG